MIHLLNSRRLVLADECRVQKQFCVERAEQWARGERSPFKSWESLRGLGPAHALWAAVGAGGRRPSHESVGGGGWDSSEMAYGQANGVTGNCMQLYVHLNRTVIW